MPSGPRSRAWRGFTKLVKWRTGCEGRIACLICNYGRSRTLRDGEAGAASWCGWGVLARNSVKIAALIAAKARPPGQVGGP
jgi:transposase, IS5 family